LSHHRIAIIDLGTNTFNLLIAEKSQNDFDIVYKTKIPAKLGAGGMANNVIAPNAFERGIAALKSYKAKTEAYNVDEIYAFATSAVRSSTNGKGFVKSAWQETGIEIDVISGDREAELIYFGIKRALDIGRHPALIMDIGGGSTEFIIADKNGILWKQSFDLGVTRLLETLSPSDPIKTEEISTLQEFLNKELAPLFNACEEYSISELIGSSGSFESLAEMIGANLKGTTEYEFQLDMLSNLHQQILNSSRAQRLNMKGLVDFRVETIVMASIFIQFILNRLKLINLRLSTYSLREGVLFELHDTN